MEQLPKNLPEQLHTSSQEHEEQSILFSRPLYLTENPAVVQQQLEIGDVVTYPGKLRDKISTDHIIRVSHLLTDNIDELGERALLGMETHYNITEKSLKNSNRDIIFAGNRFGSGSSREQAVWALKNSGVKAVVANTFGPIFDNNASNVGLLTSTNMDLISWVKEGKHIPLEMFLEGKDPLKQAVISAGGIFPYLARINAGDIPSPHIDTGMQRIGKMTIVEQRMAKAFGVPSVKVGDSALLTPDLAYSYVALSGLSKTAIINQYGFVKRTMPKQNIELFEDHFAHSEKPEIPELTKNQRFYADQLDIPQENYHKGKLSDDGGSGISHRVMIEKIDPREKPVVIATDSHTPTLGALPLLALPVGSTLLGAAIAEGKIPYSVPKTTRVELKGSLPAGFSIRDAQLEMGALNQHAPQNSVIEFGGPGLNSLKFDEVVSLCNMVPEIHNGEIAVTEAFTAGIEYLRSKFGISEKVAQSLYGKPDKEAEYDHLISYDLSKVSTWISLPGSPTNGIALSDLKEFPKIDKAIFASCTLGVDDWEKAAAVMKGQRVASNTQFTLIPGSESILKEVKRRGLTDIFEQAGAQVIYESACGPCIGEGLGAVEEDETAITSTNRNFPGRMGAKSANVFMGSPILTTISAIKGRIPTASEYQQEQKRIIKNLELWK